MSSGDPNKRSSLTAQGTTLRHTVFFQKASNVATLLMQPASRSHRRISCCWRACRIVCEGCDDEVGGVTALHRGGLALFLETGWRFGETAVLYR